LSSLAKSNGGILFKIKWRDLIQNQMGGFDSTLQNFIYKHTVDLGNVQKGIRKREKIT